MFNRMVNGFGMMWISEALRSPLALEPSGSCELRGAAEIFLDPDQLIIFGGPVGASE